MSARMSAADYKAMLLKKARRKAARPIAPKVEPRHVPDESSVPWTRLRLEVDPAPKGRHRTKAFIAKGADGEIKAKTQTYTPKATERFERAVRTMVQAQLGPRHEPLRGRVALNIAFGIPKSMANQLVTDKPDLDNIEKSLKDACNKIIYEDDSQVTWVLKRKFLVEGHGWIVIGFGPDKSATPSSELADLGYDPFNVDTNRGP